MRRTTAGKRLIALALAPHAPELSKGPFKRGELIRAFGRFERFLRADQAELNHGDVDIEDLLEARRQSLFWARWWAVWHPWNPKRWERLAREMEAHIDASAKRATAIRRRRFHLVGTNGE